MGKLQEKNADKRALVQTVVADDEYSSRADVCDLKDETKSNEKDEIRKCDDKTENRNHASCLHFGGRVGAC